MNSEIRDASLRESGALKIDWVRHHMPLLSDIREEFTRTQPFRGLRIALSVHLEAKTAYLCEVLAAGGADMYITGSNPLSTQDDVAAALVHEGLHVFAVHGATPEEYVRGIHRVLEAGPQVIIDDGGDLVSTLHAEYPALTAGVIGGFAPEEVLLAVYLLLKQVFSAFPSQDRGAILLTRLGTDSIRYFSSQKAEADSGLLPYEMTHMYSHHT